MGSCVSVFKPVRFENVLSGSGSAKLASLSQDSSHSVSTTRLTQNIVKVNLTRDIEEFYNIDEDSIIGSGMNGDVLSCVHKTTNRKYALKRLEKADVTVEDLDHIRDELSCMSYLDHPGILRVHEVFESEEHVCLVLELCTGGNLLEKLRAQYNQRFKEREACKYIHDILSAVAYCHDHNVVHRDLKLENVVFEDESKHSELKIIDFGLSKTFSMPNRMSTICGTGEYVAPEVLTGRYDARCDVWSIGVIAFMLLSGTCPFSGVTESAVLDAVQLGHYEFNDHMINNVSSDARDFIRQCLTTRPSARPSSRTALRHRWFKSISAKVRPLPSAALMKRFAKYIVRSWLAKIFTDVLSHTLAPESVVELREQFNRFDVSDTGEISLQDLRIIMKQFQGFREEFLETLLNNVNIDQTGHISYHEFLAATINRKHFTEENLQLAFELISSHREFITSADIKSLLGGSKYDVEHIMQEVGLTSSSRIDYQQFKDILNGDDDMDQFLRDTENLQ